MLSKFSCSKLSVFIGLSVWSSAPLEFTSKMNELDFEIVTEPLLSDSADSVYGNHCFLISVYVS